MSKSFFIESLGCPKNISDAEHLISLLINNDFQRTDRPGIADIIIVNTCGFINDAKEESINMIFEMASYNKILAVIGCLSERYKKELFEEIEEINLLSGVGNFDTFINELKGIDKKKRIIIDKTPAFRERIKPGIYSDDYSRYLKISDGCDNRCSYCIIPSIRGAYKSREPEFIINEAKEMAKDGCLEINLVAQDTTYYGHDLNIKTGLSDLVKQIAEIEKIEWIRLLYCYEDRIDDDLLSLYRDEKKLCKYIDMPIQHINDKMLKLMNRRSTSDSIKRTIENLRNANENIHIRTTLITGFPGETEADFLELGDFITETEFDRLGVFIFSNEEGTPAYKMKGHIPEKEKIARMDHLMKIQQDISYKLNQKKIGKTIRVLVEKKIEDDVFMARSEYDAKDIDNCVFVKSNMDLKPGSFVDVKIYDADYYDVFGQTI